MQIKPGSRLGPYEIVSRIGAGGMGEVFKARDTRLDRYVAIKVLPREFADNLQFKIRFEREARVISQLNHPHICTLHDIGQENDSSFLVMELIEGEPLADRVARGPLPVADVLRFGAEIAGALDRAHRAGIVHRDVKPGNIMITRSGVKLLDFGLAKTGSNSIGPDDETQQKALTEEGTIIGTFQYMSPEQLEGVEADARTDIFALGVVLYEMATGRQAFQGSTRAGLIAAILASAPKPISDFQPLAPAALGHVIELCLRKDREERWQSAHDLRLEMESIRDAKSPATIHRTRGRWQTMAFVAVVLTVAFLAFVAGRFLGRAPIASASRLNLVAPGRGEIIELALSPDGGLLAIAAPLEAGGLSQLWIRDLGSGSTLDVQGTADASQLFWSPDGKFVGFMRGGMLQRVAAGGGTVESICAVKDPNGASWNDEGTIVFAQDGGLYRVKATGGEARRLPAPVGEGYLWPSFLPDGKHFLVLSYGGGTGEPNPTHIAITSLDSSEAPREIVRAISNASYAAPGFLMYVKNRVLVAQRFDTRTFHTSGDPLPVGDQIDDNDFSKYVFTVANNGTVAYRSRDVRSRFHLRDRTGRELAQFGEPADWAGFVISPDGTRALAERVDENRRNGALWLIDLASGTVSRVSSGPGWHAIGAWAPDGERFAYISNSDGAFRMYEGRADSTLTRKITDLECQPQSWVGDWIGCETWAANTVADIALVSASTGKRLDIAATKSWENSAQISPDGKWIAYQSTEAGVGGIYVQPLPPNGQRWQVTSGNAGEPLWSTDGKKLYCISIDTLFEIEIRIKDGKLLAGSPQPVLEGTPKFFKNRMPYSVIGNGEKFLFNELESNLAPAHVILNWTALIPRS